MPAHKYYCDYCDKQFYDTPASRRRHLQGSSHQRAKKQWFDSFKGFLPVGSRCKFSHPQQQPSSLQYFTPSADGPQHSALVDSRMAWATVQSPTGAISRKPSAPELVVASVFENLPPSVHPPLKVAIPPYLQLIGANLSVPLRL